MFGVDVIAANGAALRSDPTRDERGMTWERECVCIRRFISTGVIS